MKKKTGCFEYNGLLLEVETIGFLSGQSVQRLYLTYQWDNKKPTLCFILFNPSYADHTNLDRTISKLINRFKNEFGKIKILNLFTVVTFNPKHIKDIEVEPTNNKILKHLENESHIVFAWGSLPKKLNPKQREAINCKVKNLHQQLKYRSLYQLHKSKQAHPLIRESINLHQLSDIIEF